jgi:hypothetical protein
VFESLSLRHLQVSVAGLASDVRHAPHSREIGDYVAWLTGEVAVFGAVLPPPFHRGAPGDRVAQLLAEVASGATRDGSALHELGSPRPGAEGSASTPSRAKAGSPAFPKIAGERITPRCAGG